STRQQPTLAGFEGLADPPPATAASKPAVVTAKTATGCGSADGQTDLTGKTVYVVDSHALIYQVFHAMPEMTGPSGQPVGAVHGFTRDILDLLEHKQPDYLFCAF